MMRNDKENNYANRIFRVGAHRYFYSLFTLIEHVILCHHIVASSSSAGVGLFFLFEREINVESFYMHIVTGLSDNWKFLSGTVRTISKCRATMCERVKRRGLPTATAVVVRRLAVARPMGAALADAIAEESLVWWCRSQCVLWGSVWCGQWGLVLNFFTYLLVVIWSFTLGGSENVPRRTTWVPPRRRTLAGIRGNPREIRSNHPRGCSSTSELVGSLVHSQRTLARSPSAPGTLASVSSDRPSRSGKRRGKRRDARAWRHAEWPRMNLVQQARVSSLTRDSTASTR